MAARDKNDSINERGNDKTAEDRTQKKAASSGAASPAASTSGIGIRAPAMLDMLSANRFWLYDVTPIDGLSLPLFQPLSGFASISSPEVTAETMDINEGNALYATKVIKGAQVGSITLSRGVSFYNADFYNWMTAALNGSTQTGTIGTSFQIGGIGGTTYRRDLMLIHFFRNFGLGIATASAEARRGMAVAASAGSNAMILAKQANINALWGIAQQAALSAFSGSVKVPARAFLLKGCIPVRYKSGADFDANTGDVSIQELEIDAHSWEEISLSAV